MKFVSPLSLVVAAALICQRLVAEAELYSREFWLPPDPDDDPAMFDAPRRELESIIIPTLTLDSTLLTDALNPVLFRPSDPKARPCSLMMRIHKEPVVTGSFTNLSRLALLDAICATGGVMWCMTGYGILITDPTAVLDRVQKEWVLPAALWFPKRDPREITEDEIRQKLIREGVAIKEDSTLFYDSENMRVVTQTTKEEYRRLLKLLRDARGKKR